MQEQLGGAFTACTLTSVWAPCHELLDLQAHKAHTQYLVSTTQRIQAVLKS